jgi:uncharacterized protein HemX
MAYKEDVNSQLIITIGAISGFLLIVLAIGLQAWFVSEEQTELNAKSATAVNYQLADLRSEQQNNITTYRWIDRDKKIAAIPIDQAERLLLENNGKLPATQPAK